MLEKFRAYLKDWDGKVVPENLDFESWRDIKNAREKGHPVEFREYDWKDASIEVNIKRPDPPKVLLPESQEDWERKREWYLKNAVGNPNLLREGISWGYIIETPRPDWCNVGFLDEVCGDFPEEAEYMQTEDYIEESLDWEYQQFCEEKKTNMQRKFPKPRDFPPSVNRLTHERINKIQKFKEMVYSGEPWKIQQFIDIGFVLPEFENKAEEFSYVVESLDGFAEAVSRKPNNQRRSALSGLVRILGLDKSLVNEARQDLWGAYEIFKTANYYTANNLQEYNFRMSEIVFALGI
jgi:hypothetical protein